MYIAALQDQHKAQRRAEALAARYANADEKAWKKYIKAFD